MPDTTEALVDLLAQNLIRRGEKAPLYERIGIHPESLGMLTSNPPTGCFKIVNIYLDRNMKLTLDYEDVPFPKEAK
jgi:hypothetical protein